MFNTFPRSKRHLIDQVDHDGAAWQVAAKRRYPLNSRALDKAFLETLEAEHRGELMPVLIIRNEGDYANHIRYLARSQADRESWIKTQREKLQTESYPDDVFLTGVTLAYESAV